MYKWKVMYGCVVLHEDDTEWETEDDAYDEAKAYVETKIVEYDIDGAEYDEDEFCIIVIDENGDEIVY